MLATEQALEAEAVERHDYGAAPVVPKRLIDRAIATKQASLGATLTRRQQLTIRGVCRSGRDLEVVVGVAGAGKTTTLDAIRHAYELDGRRVIGTATSDKQPAPSLVTQPSSHPPSNPCCGTSTTAPCGSIDAAS